MVVFPSLWKVDGLNQIFGRVCEGKHKAQTGEKKETVAISRLFQFLKEKKNWKRCKKSNLVKYWHEVRDSLQYLWHLSGYLAEPVAAFVGRRK
jgi:hypothetical protein